MNKKRVLGLILFTCVVIAGLFLVTKLMIRQQTDPNYNQSQQEIDASHEDSESAKSSYEEDSDSQKLSFDNITEEEGVYADATSENSQEANDEPENDEEAASSDTVEDTVDITTKPEEDALHSEETIQPVNEEDSVDNEDIESQDGTQDEPESQDSTQDEPESDDTDKEETSDATDTIGGSVVDLPDMQLIGDSNQVDYMKYIPDMVYDSKIEAALDIENPRIDIKAKSAILFDVKTGKVLYYKDATIPVFPASTSKLLTALVVQDWCMEEEEVTVGNELDMVATDSTKANLKKGQVLTIRNLLEGMLVPSGNDAAYVLATYVGRKSLKNENASIKEAIPEFIRLMNDKAKSLGVVNSNFKTPDGYDAIGQYTTAFDMGLIGMAAADNEVILETCNKSKARNVFVDGKDVTWSNTNSLIVKESGRYYPYCVGLKTGTSTMAGRCLISVAKKDDQEVVSVVMNSDTVGRWEDSTILLKYGLGN